MIDGLRTGDAAAKQRSQSATTDPVLGPLFVQHASPEAIEARIREASAREHAAAREVNALLALYRERSEQITRGEWPLSEPGSSAAVVDTDASSDGDGPETVGERQGRQPGSLSGLAEKKLACGCYVAYGQGNTRGVWSISAVAFLCDQGHKQGDITEIVETGHA